MTRIFKDTEQILVLFCAEDLVFVHPLIRTSNGSTTT